MAQESKNMAELKPYRFVVHGAGNKSYRVVQMEHGEWTCECPDFNYHKNKACKHIISVIQKLAKREKSANAQRQAALI